MDKLKEMFKMIDNEEREKPSEKFKNYLSSLPVELVSTTEVSSGFTLLQNSVFENKKEHVCLLLQHGVNPKATATESGDSPLKMAFEKGFLEVYGAISDFIEDPEVKKLCNLLRMLKTDEDLSKDDFKSLLESIPKEMTSSSIKLLGNLTLVQFAAREGRIEHLRLLLESGLDPATVSEEHQETAIELAAKNGHVEVVSLLAPLMEGSEAPRKIDEKMNQAKLQAMFKMIDSEEKDKPSKMFKNYLSSLPVKLVTSSVVLCGYTLLKNSIYEGKKEHARLLLEHGVNPLFSETGTTKSAFEFAFDRGQIEVSDMIAKFIEDPSEKTFYQLGRFLKDEETPTIKSGFKSLLESIPKETTILSNKFLDNTNLVQYVAKEGKAEHLRLLLDSGLDPAAVSEDQEKLAIELAAENGHDEVVTLLAPLMEGSEALARSRETLNSEKLRRLNRMIDQEEEDKPSEEFKKCVLSLPVELVSSRAASYGYSLLQNCVADNKIEHARIVLQHGVDPKASESGHSPLKMASFRDYDKILDLLVEHVKDPDEKNVHIIARFLQNEEPTLATCNNVKSLLKSSQKEITSSKIELLDNLNLVQFAAREGKAEHLRLLLDSGLDPAAVSEDQEKTAIELAAENCHAEVVSLLAPLMEGSEALRKSREALNQAKLQAMTFMIEQEEKDKPSEKFKNYLSSLPVELVSSTAVTSVNTCYTLLQTSVHEKKTEHARLLLQRGVNPACKTELGDSPLKMASIKGSLELFEVLLEYVKDPASLNFYQVARLVRNDASTINDSFKNLLESIPKEMAYSRDEVLDNLNLVQFVAREGKVEDLRQFLESGLDPAFVSEDQEKTAIELAAENCHVEVVSLLAPLMEGSEALRKSREALNQAKLRRLYRMIDQEMDKPSEKFKDWLSSLPVELVSSSEVYGGFTLLQNSVYENKKEHACFLLQHGVNPKATGKESGDSPIEMALTKGFHEVFDALAEYAEETVEIQFYKLASKLKNDEASTETDVIKSLIESIPKEMAGSSNSFLDKLNLVQYAAREGKAEHLRLLLDSGLDPAAVTEDQEKTAIELAAENCHVEVVSLLAPLMEGSEALRKSREALNQAMLNVEQGGSCSLGHSLDILVPGKEAGSWRCDAGNNCPQARGYNNGQGGTWRCDKDKRWRRGGTCDFDVCVSCMAKYQKLREEKMVENSTIRMMLALGEEEKEKETKAPGEPEKEVEQV